MSTQLSEPFSIVIPARLKSARLPNKPLLHVEGKPVIQHTYERAVKSGAQRVVVATNDLEILDAVNKFNGEVLLTKEWHVGTQKVAEATKTLNLNGWVVNWQSDEPFVNPEWIHDLVRTRAMISTLCAPIPDEGLGDFNQVKVVLSGGPKPECLYFSRAGMLGSFGHIGIYCFHHHFLKMLPENWTPSRLSRAENLEQLTWIEDGYTVRAVLVHQVPLSINSRSDYLRMQAMLAVNKK